MPRQSRIPTGTRTTTGTKTHGRPSYDNAGGGTEIQPGGGSPGGTTGPIYGFANHYNNDGGVTGGAGGSIVHVTTTTDNVAGSLRTALTTSGTRTIVFDVAGTFNLAGTSRVAARGNLTIAGETAPSPGVTITGVGIGFNSEGNVIYRNIRHRGASGSESEEFDPIAFNGTQGFVIYRCSLSGARSECVGSYHGAKWASIQECIIGPAVSPTQAESRAILFSDDSGSPAQEGCSVFRTVIKSVYRNPAFGYKSSTDELSPTTTGDAANMVVHNVGLLGPGGTAYGYATTTYHGAKSNVRYCWYNTVNGMDIGSNGQCFSQGNYSKNGRSMTGNAGSAFAIPAGCVLPFTADARAAATSVLASAGCRIGGLDAYDQAIIDEITAVGI